MYASVYRRVMMGRIKDLGWHHQLFLSEKHVSGSSGLS